MDLLAAVRGLPGGPALLAAADDHTHLVGGAVRDLLLGRRPRELDVVTEAEPLELARRLSSNPSVHDRFGTATLVLGDARIDIARSRRERYTQPGALPEVEPAPLAEDLLRRDFTVNAIALALVGGELRSVPRALEDLDARVLRVLHDVSFTDDPTRLLRMARYEVRLGFAVEPHTARLASAATLATVSGARVGAELRLALDEPDPLAVLERLPGLPLEVDRGLTEAALGLLPPDANPSLLMLASATRDAADRSWLDTLELTARERDTVVAAWEAEELALGIGDATRPSELHRLLRDQPVEAVALAGALGPAANARLWLERLRLVKLEITGADLIAAGLREGPDVGARLERVLAQKLDGLLPAGRSAELEAALASPA